MYLLVFQEHTPAFYEVRVRVRTAFNSPSVFFCPLSKDTFTIKKTKNSSLKKLKEFEHVFIISFREG
jgi:hypothetical protein